jgi:ABC-type antimicrobial peptide transport system permease subunit
VITNSVRQEIKNYNAGLSVRSVETLPTLVKDTIRTQIIIAKLSSFFGGLALLLACIGLYGVMSYTVAGRTKEIGIRMALGAQQRNVIGFVMRQAFSLVIFGVFIGVPLAMLSARVFTSMLFGLTNTDPLSLGIAVALLATVGALAGMIPARRATRIDPMVALREE